MDLRTWNCEVQRIKFENGTWNLELPSSKVTMQIFKKCFLEIKNIHLSPQSAKTNQKQILFDRFINYCFSVIFHLGTGDENVIDKRGNGVPCSVICVVRDVSCVRRCVAPLHFHDFSVVYIFHFHCSNFSPFHVFFFFFNFFSWHALSRRSLRFGLHRKLERVRRLKVGVRPSGSRFFFFT